MALISVVIPCYNVEKYIDRCMYTLVNQTIGLENLELILVNDASTDNTLNKLIAWEAKYPDNIMVINYDENLRQGGARNVGIRYATSDYVGFVDADDFVEFYMYETLYEKVKEGAYDVVRAEYVIGQYESNAYVTLPKKANRNDYVLQGAYMNGWYAYDFSKMPKISVVYTSIYKRSIIVDNNVWFPERLAYEDNCWFNIMKLYIRNICIIDEQVYHYCINDGSTVQSRNKLSQLDRLTTELMILDKYKEVGAFEYYKEYLERDFLQRFYANTLYLIFTKFDYIPDIFEYMRERILEYFPNYKSNRLLNEFTFLDKGLLTLLDIPGKLEPKDLEIVKKAYLESSQLLTKKDV